MPERPFSVPLPPTAMAKEQCSSGGVLAMAQKFAFYSAVAYAIMIGVLMHPFVQRHASFQNAARRITPGAPEAYGLAPGKTHTFTIQTPDNESIGSWFILAEPYYQAMRSAGPLPVVPSLDTVEHAIRTWPTVLYLHGAAATRAAEWRIQHYNTFSARLQVNILAIDYRGFGDSTGSPSEEGVVLDAHSAWDWLLEHGAQPENVLIVGHSLGTGVAGKLGSQLAREGVKPRGVVLTAPFSSIVKLVETYDIFGIPILQPMQAFAWTRNIITKLVLYEFDTLSVIQDINVPTLIVHSRNDEDVPYLHSRTLLDRLLDPLLPPSVSLPPAPGSPIDVELLTQFREAQEKRKAARTVLVKREEVPNFGTIEQFEGVYGQVMYVETLHGSHAHVGLQEGVQNTIGDTFKLGAAARSA